MLDACVIFTRGGIILWKEEINEVDDQLVDHLIQEVLIEEKQSLSQFSYGDYNVKWCYANDYNLVFVGIYLAISRTTGVEDVLSAIRSEFCSEFSERLKNEEYFHTYNTFLEPYNHILKHFEKQNSRGKKGVKSISKEIEEEDPEINDLSIRLSSTILSKKKNNTVKSPNPKKKGKEATKWEDSKLSAHEEAALNFSNENENDSNSRLEREADELRKKHGEIPKGKYWEMDDDKEDGEEVAEDNSGIWSYFQGLLGQKPLTKEDLEGVRKQFIDKLIQKNVATVIADKLVDGVIVDLIGKRVGSLQTLHQTVRKGLESALNRILTPNKPVDVLMGVSQARDEGRPYSIVFCGVNGVGKSTSLSKIAAFFLSQGLTVGVAACDTFRSGAIEQLKTHCKALNIPLYDKGYGRDEATVAAEGIASATRDGLDVILIDTAGRMQGNESLMKGLANLMNSNDPDLILFVGEALVGNDGCDQLVNFNRALANNSGRQNPRLIDGVVLTKFDTIDDKVGAAISMTYSTGQPIVFVGTGQTYKDLKKPDSKMLINSLLK